MIELMNSQYSLTRLIATHLTGDRKDAGRIPVPLNMLTDRLSETALGQLGFTILQLPSTLQGIDLSHAPTIGIKKISLLPKAMEGSSEQFANAILQSGPALEQMILKDLLDSLVSKIFYEIINGTGMDNSILGIRNTPGIGCVIGGPNGATFAWPHVIGLESSVTNANNAEPDATSGYLINTKTRGICKSTPKAPGFSPIWDGGETPLNGYRVAVSNYVPSNLTKGSATNCSSVIFSSSCDMAVLAFFGVPEIVVDFHAEKTLGLVKIKLNQYVDFGIRNPAAFAVMDDALTS